MRDLSNKIGLPKIKIFNQHKVREYSQDEATEKISEDDCTRSMDEVLDGGSTPNAVSRGSQHHPVEQNHFDSDSQRKEQQVIVSDVEIDYGTGFIVDTQFIDNPDLSPDCVYIVTSKHVIQAVLDDTKKEARICNQFLDDLPCDERKEEQVIVSDVEIDYRDRFHN